MIMLLKAFYTNYTSIYMQRHYVQGYGIIPWLHGHAVVYVVGGDVCMLSCNAYTQFPYKPCMYTSHVVHNVHTNIMCMYTTTVSWTSCTVDT